MTLSAGASHAWTLVYSHDANGTATAGSLQTLRNAALNGSSVAIVTSTPGVHDWQVTCTHVSIRHDNGGQDVICVNHLDLWTDATPGATFGTPYQPPQSAQFTANTRGQYTHISIRKDNGSVILTNQMRLPIRWYVK
jgi:hypothetical protein